MTDEDRPDKNDVPEGWVCVYSLGCDARFVAQVQKASLETEDFGFPAEPALFGSPGWWAMIDDGTLPSYRLDGVITRAGWGSMGDWPEYTLTAAGGTTHNLTRQGDTRRYAVGIRARVQAVELRRKQSQAANRLGATTSQVLTTFVEDSLLRSSLLAAGPGGDGFGGLAGPPGWYVHYVWSPDRLAAEAMAEDLERAGRRARVWDAVMGGAWAAITLPPDPDGAQQKHLAAAAGHGGKYDGYDVIPVTGESVAVGPHA